MSHLRGELYRLLATNGWRPVLEQLAGIAADEGHRTFDEHLDSMRQVASALANGADADNDVHASASNATYFVSMASQLAALLETAGDIDERK